MADTARNLPAPVAALQNEHRYMELLLETVMRRLRQHGLQSGSDYFLIQDIARYMHEYPDIVHHPTEDLLFERLVKRHPASKMEVERLRNDHKRLEASTANIMELLEAASKERTATANDAARKAIERYIDYLRGHMQFEESVLFPRAVDCLTNSDWKSIGTELDRVEDPLFGRTIGAEYRPLYEYFSKRTENVSRALTKFEFLQFDTMIISADALERGVTAMWELASRYVDVSLAETRSAAKRVVSKPGPCNILSAPFRLATSLGSHTVGFGSDAAGILIKTTKGIVSPYWGRKR